MDLMLHICCAPCSLYSREYFTRLGYDPTGFFFNPNIHPYKEFSQRLASLKDFEQGENRQLIVDERYLMEDFLRLTLDTGKGRCSFCYEMRLQETARKAAGLGIANFSTTLLISPYQDHTLIKAAGERAGKKAGVKFVYADLRSGFGESMEKARDKGLYRQNYCGCIFSEKERFLKNS